MIILKTACLIHTAVLFFIRKTEVSAKNRNCLPVQNANETHDICVYTSYLKTALPQEHTAHMTVFPYIAVLAKNSYNSVKEKGNAGSNCCPPIFPDKPEPAADDVLQVLGSSNFQREADKYTLF